MDPVQEQLDAYNARDLERFLACYAPDVVMEDGAGNILAQGHDAMRQVYGTLFAQSPNLHCRLGQRIRVGSYVIDEEFVTGVNLAGFPPEVHGAIVYTVVDDKITRVRTLM